MKSLGKVSLIALIALTFGFTAQARSNGYHKAANHMEASHKGSHAKKHRGVASTKKHKKKHKKSRRH